MTEITFSDKSTYEFIQQLLKDSESSQVLKADDTAYTVEIRDQFVSKMVLRLANGLPSIIPLTKDLYDEWILIAETNLEVDQTLQQVSRFLLPSFGTFYDNAIFPQPSRFDNAPQNISSNYYSWYSPTDLREHVEEKIETWLMLVSRCPSFDQMTPPNFKDLYHRFRQALSKQDWTEAQGAIKQLKDNHLTQNYNIAFLYIELLASQHDYEAIWQAEELKRWVFHTVPIPRRVQVAILRAFHQQKLLFYEQVRDFDTIFLVLKQERTTLGRLLAYRHDIIDDVVVRIFGYLSVIDDTVEALDDLLQLPSINEESRHILESLEQIIRPAPKVSQFERFQQLIHNRSYDAALAVANDIQEPVQQLTALLQATALLSQEHSGDHLPIQQIFDQFHALEEGDQTQLLQQPLNRLAWAEIERQAKELKAKEVYRDWIEWFDALFHSDRNTEKLQKSVAYLEETSDKEFWTLERVDQFWQIIGAMTFDPKGASPEDQMIAAQPYFERAMLLLIAQFTEQDTEFPRLQSIYGNLYGVFLEYILYRLNAVQENADMLFQLLDDQLSRNPDSISEKSKTVFRWLEPPRPEVNAIALEAFEVVIQHGLGKESLYNQYRVWVEQLMDAPLEYDRASLEVWKSLGEWFGDNADYLTSKVRARLETEDSKALDPVSQLPNGYRIVIYTLDATSAQRVSQILQERQPELRIDICTDDVVTDRMKSLTQNADMHVIVWRCMKHNVFYGISPYIDDPVLPPSRGSSSILREIESRIRKDLRL